MHTCNGIVVNETKASLDQFFVSLLFLKSFATVELPGFLIECTVIRSLCYHYSAPHSHKEFTEAGQDAPGISAGEEWPFLLWGLGWVVLKHMFVHLLFSLDMPVNI